jgi:hypothetical protein
VRDAREFISQTENAPMHRPMSRFLTSLELPTGAVTGLCFGSHYQSVIAVGASKKYFQFGLPG